MVGSGQIGLLCRQSRRELAGRLDVMRGEKVFKSDC